MLSNMNVNNCRENVTQHEFCSKSNVRRHKVKRTNI